MGESNYFDLATIRGVTPWCTLVQSLRRRIKVLECFHCAGTGLVMVQEQLSPRMIVARKSKACPECGGNDG